MSSAIELVARNTPRLARRLIPLLVGCAVCCAGKNYAGESHMNQPTELMIPAIAIEADAQYVLDFPILITVILRNETTDTDYLNLPDLGLLNPIDSLAVELQSADGGSEVRLGPSFRFRDKNIFRTQLMAGQAKRALIDLSQLGQPLTAGRYRLKVSIFERSSVSRSSPFVNLEFLEPSAVERAEAARLRRLGLRPNLVDYGSWLPFLTSNWNTVSISQSLGKRASEQLALHLALHKAAYGPEPLTRFPLDVFQNLQDPVLSAEAASLTYELVAARATKPEIQTARSQLLQRWPDLKARLDQIDKGEGTLRTLRKGYGVERDPPLPPGPRPYTVP